MFEVTIERCDKHIVGQIRIGITDDAQTVWIRLRSEDELRIFCDAIFRYFEKKELAKTIFVVDAPGGQAAGVLDAAGFIQNNKKE